MPRIAPRALPNDAAQVAINARLLSGDLESWADILDIFNLEPGSPVPTKTGPTNTMSLLAGFYWLNWAQQEVGSGFQNIDVAVVPIAGNSLVLPAPPTSNLTIFTGTGSPPSPQITNLGMAIGSDTSPNGPYPLNSIALAVDAPTVAPTVVPIVPPSGGTVTKETYTSNFTGWTSGASVSPFSWTYVPGVGGSGLVAGVEQGFYAAAGSGPSNYAYSPALFSFATATQFTLNLDISTAITSTLNSNDGYIRLSTGGNGAGGNLQLNFRDGGSITWQDQAGGGAITTIAPGGTVTNTRGYNVNIIAVAGTPNASNVNTYNVSVTVTEYLTPGSPTPTAVVFATSVPLTLTYGGENILLGGVNGLAGQNVSIFVARITISSTQPTTVVPVFSSYVYTEANVLGFESSTSPASTVVQVDNGYQDLVTIVPLVGAAPAVSEIFLYRAATGTSSTSFLSVVNGLSADGGFQIVTVGVATPNFIPATTPDNSAPLIGTSYFFTATMTNTGPTVFSLNGSPFALVDTSGAPLTASAVIAGQNYTAEFEAPYISNATGNVSAGPMQTVIPVTNTTGAVFGCAITDNQGAIPPGTTIVSVQAGVSFTLSQGLTANMTIGDIIAVSPAVASFTLRAGFAYLDFTPTADLGSALVTTDFDPPPSDMQGIIALPNAIMAAFDTNELLLSEQGFPYAFPLKYRLPTDSQVVAIAVIDATVIILTQSRPYTAYGNTPAAFVMTREEFIQGCVAKRSVSYLRGLGVIYASTDGIYAYAGQGQIRSLTENYFTIREWLPLNPPSIIGTVHQGLYFFWYTTLDGTKGGYILDPTPNGFGLVEMDWHCIAVALNSSDDSLFMVLDEGVIAAGVTPANNELVQFDAAPTLRPYVWKSKLWQFQHPTTFVNWRVRAGNYITSLLQLFSDRAQFGSVVPSTLDDYPMPSVNAGHEFECQFTGTADIQTVEFAEDVVELA